MNTEELHNNILELVLKETDFFTEKDDLSIKEVGDGNVNYIFRVSEGNESLIVKFADSFIRNSTTRALSTVRSAIENEILKKQAELTDGMVPKVYHYSPEMNCIIMEDMKDYQVLREAMMNKETFAHFGKDIAQFLYNTLVKTTDVVMDPEEKKELLAKLVNLDMCEISERLVFTEPYLNTQKLNKFHANNQSFVEDNVYNNETLKLEVSKLKNRFMNKSESMIHGDLHAGSIFINDKSLKVFDPEFSFYGPMGYDIGNVIGSFIITYVVNKLENSDEDLNFTNWVKGSIKTLVESFIEIYEKNIENDAQTKMLNNKAFTDFYLTQILSDSAAYAGTEMIRRTIGVAKVWDLERVQDDKNIELIEKTLIKIGTELILNRDKMLNAKSYEELLNKNVKEDK